MNKTIKLIDSYIDEQKLQNTRISKETSEMLEELKQAIVSNPMEVTELRKYIDGLLNLIDTCYKTLENVGEVDNVILNWYDLESQKERKAIFEDIRDTFNQENI